MGRAFDDLSLALHIEQRFPTLNDSLASTVQFLALPAADGDSASLRREAVKAPWTKPRAATSTASWTLAVCAAPPALAALATTSAVVLALFFPVVALQRIGPAGRSV